MYLTVCNKQTFKFGEARSTVAKPIAKGETNVTRIKALDSEAANTDKKAVKATKPSAKKPAEKAANTAVEAADKPTRKNVFVRIGAYFKGAWQELRLVRWPNRKATWGMTGALIVFTLFFVVVILLLDYGFSQLFKLILGSN